MCKVYQESKIQDVNLNRKTIFNCEEKQYISKQKCKVNPGIVTESDLPEITLLVVDKNKQCNHSLHCLFWIITPLVFRCYSISIFSSCSLSVFSKRPVHRHFS